MGPSAARQNPLPAGRLIPSNTPVALPEYHRRAVRGEGRIGSPAHAAIDQNMTEMPSEKLDSAPSRYHN